MMHGRALHHHCRKPNYTRIETCEELFNMVRFTGKEDKMRAFAVLTGARSREYCHGGKAQQQQTCGVAVCEFVCLFVSIQGKNMRIEESKKCNNSTNQSQDTYFAKAVIAAARTECDSRMIRL
jgi:hypothetical protein